MSELEKVKAWSTELQKRLIAAGEDQDADVRNLMGEAACCLAALSLLSEGAAQPVADIAAQKIMADLDDRKGILDDIDDDIRDEIKESIRTIIAAASPLPQRDAEQERAIMEGERNASCEEYFKARPQIDCIDRRRVFEAGFQRGFVAALSAKEQQK